MNGIWILFVIAFALVGWQLATGEILAKSVLPISITRESNSVAFWVVIGFQVLLIAAGICFFVWPVDLKLGR